MCRLFICKLRFLHIHTCVLMCTLLVCRLMCFLLRYAVFFIRVYAYLLFRCGRVLSYACVFVSYCILFFCHMHAIVVFVCILCFVYLLRFFFLICMRHVISYACDMCCRHAFFYVYTSSVFLSYAYNCFCLIFFFRLHVVFCMQHAFFSYACICFCVYAIFLLSNYEYVLFHMYVYVCFIVMQIVLYDPCMLCCIMAAYCFICILLLVC